MLARAQAIALIAFALLLGLVEGPAEIACLGVLAFTFAKAGFRRYRPGIGEIGILVWGLAGLWGVAGDHARGSSEDTFRPLLALALLVGRVALDDASEVTLRRMALAFGAAIALNGAYGYLQLAFKTLPLDELFLKNRGSSQLWVPGYIGGYKTVSGLFYNRLKLAHVGIAGLGLFALVAVRAQARVRTRVLALLGLCVLGGAVILSYARMALAALGLGAVSTAVVVKRGRALVLLGAVMVAIALFVLGFSSFARERRAAIGADLEIREKVLAVGAGIARTHPILGVGHGMYRITAQAANTDRGLTREWLIDAHNLFLHVLAETGIVGLAGFLVGVFVPLFGLARKIRRNRGDDSPRAMLDVLAFFVIVAILALGIVHYPLHHASVALVFWTLLGVAQVP